MTDDHNANECLAGHLVAFLNSAIPDLTTTEKDPLPPEEGEPTPMPPHLTREEIIKLTEEIETAVADVDVAKLKKIAKITRAFVGQLAGSMPGE